MGIRMMSFLMLTLLASGCSGSNCSCKCLFPEAKKSGYVCDLINKLQTSEDTNKVTINELLKGKTDLTISTEKEIQKAEVKISALERNVVELKNQSRELLNWTLALEESMSDERTRLMEDSKREARRQRDALALRQRGFQDEISAKWQQQENEMRKLEQEMADKSEEDRKRTSEAMKELLERVEKAESKTMESKTEILDKLRQSEDRLREIDRFVQNTTDVVAELSRGIQKATASVTNSEKLQEELEKMQSTVSSLLTSQSELRRNLSSLVKTGIEQPFEKLTDLTTEIKKEEAKQVELEKNLSQCFGKISGLDGVVSNHVQSSSFEHQRLRSEMVGHVTQLKAECVTRSVVDQTIASLSASLQETQENLTELGKMVNCKDFLPAANCMNKVRRNRCHVPNIAFRCCASCARAGK